MTTAETAPAVIEPNGFSFEVPAYNALFLVVFFLNYLSIALAGLRLHLVWRELAQFLRQLPSCSFAPAFSRLHERVKDPQRIDLWSSSRSLNGFQRSIGIVRDMLERRPASSHSTNGTPHADPAESADIVATYQLFAPGPHVEILVDRQGYIRAIWRDAPGAVQRQVEALNAEKSPPPFPDDHVH